MRSSEWVIAVSTTQTPPSLRQLNTIRNARTGSVTWYRTPAKSTTSNLSWGSAPVYSYSVESKGVGEVAEAFRVLSDFLDGDEFRPQWHGVADSSRLSTSRYPGSCAP